MQSSSDEDLEHSRGQEGASSAPQRPEHRNSTERSPKAHVASASPPKGTIVDTALAAVRETADPPPCAIVDTALANSNVAGGSVQQSTASSQDENRKPAQSVAEWKAQAVEAQQKAAISTRERLREEYAKLAKSLKVGDRCVVSGHRGVIAFLGEDVESLPGGFWVGVRYDEPVGKNDGRVKGVKLFECQPNYGHVVRPDKVMVVDPNTPPRALGTQRRGSSVSPLRPKRIGAVSSRPMSASPHLKRSSSSSPPPPHTRRANTTSPPLSKGDLSSWAEQDPAQVIGSDQSVEETMPRQRVGLVYDPRMEAHACPGRAEHPEKPARISAIFSTLAARGLAQRCVRIPARPAADAELRSVHTADHVQQMMALKAAQQDELDVKAGQYNSVYLCPASTSCALLAAGTGSVVEATRRVCCGEVGKAVCVVRPPGHHALPACAMGFCLFANVSVAASEARRRGWASKVLILDWDVHLGNGTQAMFLEDPNVLVFSIHRYDNGSFYPGGPDGDMTAVGKGEGAGFNVNVPWPRGGAGDADYKGVMTTLFLPIAREFKPDLVLVSAGFDAAAGDPLGGCKVTAGGFGMMTRALRELAGGRVVLALEGGYNLRATADSLAACVSALLSDEPLATSDDPPLFEDTVRRVAATHSQYWSCCAWAAEQPPAKAPESTAAAAGAGRAAAQTAESEVERLALQVEGVGLTGALLPVASPPNSCAAVRASSASDSDSSRARVWRAFMPRGSHKAMVSSDDGDWIRDGSPRRISPPTANNNPSPQAKKREKDGVDGGN